jgi:hypothetical protein
MFTCSLLVKESLEGIFLTNRRSVGPCKTLETMVDFERGAWLGSKTSERSSGTSVMAEGAIFLFIRYVDMDSVTATLRIIWTPTLPAGGPLCIYSLTAHRRLGHSWLPRAFTSPEGDSYLYSPNLCQKVCSFLGRVLYLDRGLPGRALRIGKTTWMLGSSAYQTLAPNASKNCFLSALWDGRDSMCWFDFRPHPR